MRTLWRKLRWRLDRRRRESEIHEELAFHLALEQDAAEAMGATGDEAARRARLDLGNVALVTEDVRALAGGTIFLLVVAVVACYIPARAGTRVNPAEVIAS